MEKENKLPPEVLKRSLPHCYKKSYGCDDSCSSTEDKGACLNCGFKKPINVIEQIIIKGVSR